MRSVRIFILAGLLTGCATAPPVETAKPAAPAVAAALVFDPPIAIGQAPIDLPRDQRGAAAFAGFEQTTTSYFGVYSENRQADDGSDRVVNDTIQFKYGSVQR